jgi:predicted dehydrogenase
MKFMFRDCPLPPLEFLRQCDGLQDAMTHDFDLCFSLVDEKPSEVFATGSNFIPEIKGFGYYDTRIITVKFPSGIMATFDG